MCGCAKLGREVELDSRPEYFLNFPFAYGQRQAPAFAYFYSSGRTSLHLYVLYFTITPEQTDYPVGFGLHPFAQARGFLRSCPTKEERSSRLAACLISIVAFLVKVGGTKAHHHCKEMRSKTLTVSRGSSKFAPHADVPW